MIRSILVPTDFSANAEAAAEYACSLAEGFHSSVTLLHVFSSPIIATPDATFAPTTEELRALAAVAAEKLAALAQRLERPGLTLRTAIVEGDPTVRILDASAEADLIVMGTHGRGPVARMLLGSVAEHVVRGARCPVMTLTHYATQPTLQRSAAV
jgi:nucleotide-binding universal stress UspA family protein